MSWRAWLLLIIIIGGVGVFFFSKNNKITELIPIFKTTNMDISSPAFPNGGDIPIQYTCQGDSSLIPLTISKVPKNAQTLALIMDDPDAPNATFVHWVVFNIPPTTTDLEYQGYVYGSQAVNSAGVRGYTAPCPPSGSHRYYFKLYALNISLVESDINNKADLELNMAGHIVGQTELIGVVKHLDQ
ncbi:MAG TPA: YbhB/YbcL family Raf kinase inhibitor-like protein [Methylomirabilota bacterium]|jgi:Raf kinase inhibitor-like YbhB/YbcL family protein|nr:YbhB/YbcL family Raf kinase inhibitor-like protein [Methylomirabilota bacterium]